MFRTWQWVLVCLWVLPVSVSGEVLRRFTAAQKIQVASIAADRDGNLIVVGVITGGSSIGKALRLGTANDSADATDGFLLKLAPDGRQMAAVMFGGQNSDWPQKVAVDPNGNIVVVGGTTSPDFPLLNPLLGTGGGGTDLFVCRFDATGTNLLSSTTLGGRDYESVDGLAVDGNGDIVVSGQGYSDDFPSDPTTFNSLLGRPQSFLFKLAASGEQLLYAFRFGGSFRDLITAVSADAEGNTYVAGYTASSDFPLRNAMQSRKPLDTTSGFFAKFAPDGALLFSSFLAGNSDDSPEAIAVNGAGEILISGNTYSSHFPALPAPILPGDRGVNPRAFLVKLDPTGTAVLSRGQLSLSSYDTLTAISVQSDGEVLAAGTVGSGNGLPLFARLNDDGSLETLFDRLDCEPTASFVAMATGIEEDLFVVSSESRGDQKDYVVSRLRAAELSHPETPRVKLIAPAQKSVIAVRGSARLEAVVVGATGTVASVKFYAGRRLIGEVTEPPYTVRWTNTSQGVFNLGAVAEVEGRSVKSCPVRVSVRSPSNDKFSRATKLSGSSVDVRGDVATASAEANESQWDYYAKSVWYSWRAPRTGTFSFKVTSDFGSHSLRAFTGSNLETLVSVGNAYRDEMTLVLSGGVEYKLRVAGSGYSETDGGFRLQISPVTAPANDDFSTARLLKGTVVSIAGTTLHATSEDDEAIGSYDYPTVWYVWTAPESGLFLLSVDGMGSFPSLRVFTGTALTNLDSIGQNIYGETNGVALYALAGTKYYLSAMGGDEHPFRLAIAPHQPPPNDHFADRIVMPSGPGTIRGTSIGATDEPGEPGAYYQPKHSVWWSWSPQTAGVYSVTMRPIWRPVTVAARNAPSSPAAYSQPVSVFVGDALHQLAPIPNGELRTGNTVIFEASSDTNYLISVTADAAGFELEVASVENPANDDFDAALELVGPVAIKVGSTWGATLEPDEAAHAKTLWSPGYWDSVWYRWVAPSNGLFSFSANNASVLDLYQGSALANVVLVASNANNHVVPVIAGVEYRLAVAGGNGFELVVRPASPPSNDQFANRQLIYGVNVRFDGNTRDATAESGEPPHAGSAARRSIWYSWTAPVSGRYALGFTNLYQNDRIAAYVGNSLTGLVLVAQHSYQVTPTEFVAEAGVTHQIAVEGASPSAPRVGMEVRYIAPPPNDHFANRRRISGTPISLVASNVGATMEVGEPVHGSAEHGATVWWTWRAPRTGRATFAVKSAAGFNGFSGTLGVFVGSELDNLVSVADADPYWSAVNVSVEAGREYHLSVDGAGSPPSGHFGLEIYYTKAPANDAFASRRRFTTVASGSLDGATLQPGEPGLEADPSAGSVWWTWTAPATGVYEFTFTAGFGNKLRLFTGTTLDTLERVGEGAYWENWVRIQANKGDVYVMQVSGHIITDPYSVAVTFQKPPDNDHFVQRSTLSGTNISIVASNLAATAEPDEPLHDGSEPKKSVWWTWTAPVSGTVVIDFSDYFWERIAAYTGDQLSNLEGVANGAGRISFPVESGRSYQIAVDTAYGYPEGSTSFTGSLHLHLPPANDHFTNRVVLIGDSIVTTGTTRSASVELGEPHAPHPAGKSVWWQWTAPETARYTVVVIGEELIEADLLLFTGTQLTNLTLVASNHYPRPALNVDLTAGTEVSIKVDGDWEPQGDQFELRIHQADPPANDDFASRAEFVGPSMDGDLEGSTRELNEEIYPYEPSDTSIWWTFTPTNTGWYSVVVNPRLESAAFAATASSFRLPPFPPGPVPPNPTTPSRYQDGRVFIGVYSGSNLAGLIWNAPYLYRSQNLFRLEAGTPYTIKAAGLEGWFGPVTLFIDFIPSPVNDHFANALEMVGLLANGSLVGSARERGEPAYDADPDGTSIWWTLVPATSGWYSVRANPRDEVGGGGGQDPRTYARVYTGSALTNQVILPGSPLQFLEAGNPYVIEVAGRNGWFGPVQLLAEFVPGPVNDHFTNAVEIVGESVRFSGINVSATPDPGEPPRVWFHGENSVWWKWTAPRTAVYTVAMEGLPYPYIHVYEGREITELNRVTNATDGRDAGNYIFRAQAGVTYHVCAGTPRGQEGVVRLTLAPANPPPNDDFAQRIQLEGAFVSLVASNYDATAEPGDPMDGSTFRSKQTVWWKWTAPFSGRLRIKVDSDSGDVFAFVYVGSSLPNLTLVGPSSGVEEQEFGYEYDISVGVEYSFLVVSLHSDATEFTLTLDAMEVAPEVKSASAIRLPLSFKAASQSQVIETSTNLIDWLPFQNVTPGQTTLQVVPNLNESQRFFRVR